MSGQGNDGSIAFDRSVAYYDRTRGLTEEAVRELVRVLGAELEGHGTCLDVGVGTGLMALPLREAGVQMAGVDLSGPMVAELVRKAGGRTPFPLALGDGTRLPFGAAAFGAALMRHVLHLIRDWPSCVAEVARVVEPGGVVLVGHGDYPAEWRRAQEHFLDLLGRTRRFHGWSPGDIRVLDREFATHGARGRDLESVEEKASESLGDFIRQMGEGLHSWTWTIEPEDRQRAAELTREWAAEHFGTLDPPGARTWNLTWRAYDLPSGG